MKLKKSQVAIFFITAIATIIVLAFIVVNIGKIGKDKTYTANAADAGALAGASVMATGFNYVADQNDSDVKGNMKEAHNRQANSRTASQQKKSHQVNKKNNSDEKQAWESSSGYLSPAARPGDTRIIHEGNAAAQTIVDAEEHRLDHVKNMQQKLDIAKRTLDGNKKTRDNYYNQALTSGYYYNFLNSGVAVKTGGTQAGKRFEQFLQSITPQTVQNGQPLTFSWIDGAARAHMVTAIMEIEPVDNWKVKTNKDDEDTQQVDARKAEANFRNTKTQGGLALMQRLLGIVLPKLDPIIFTPAGTANENAAHTSMQDGFDAHTKFFQGQQESDNSKLITHSKQAEPYTVAYVEDIVHSQTVFSANFQLHMGGPIKGMRGDIDVPTFYPPVQSSATASFNCTGQGMISRGDALGDSVSGFEACLIATF